MLPKDLRKDNMRKRREEKEIEQAEKVFRRSAAFSIVINPVKTKRSAGIFCSLPKCSKCLKRKTPQCECQNYQIYYFIIAETDQCKDRREFLPWCVLTMKT